MRSPFTLICLIILCSSAHARTGYEVSGNVSGLGTTDLLILHLDGDDLPRLDTVSAFNDCFRFSGQVRDPYFVQILLITGKGKTRKLTEFMLENSCIRISGSSPDYNHIKVNGSDSDRILKEYLAEDKLLGLHEESFGLMRDMLLLAGDSVRARELTRDIHQTYLVQRINLLKEYVIRYSNQTVGALLPNFCLLQKDLRPGDFLELYRILAPDIRQSPYGQSLYQKSLLQ